MHLCYLFCYSIIYIVRLIIEELRWKTTQLWKVLKVFENRVKKYTYQCGRVDTASLSLTLEIEGAG